MSRINPDGFYVDGVPLDQSYWRALDTAQFQSLNGDLGSSHNPSSPIVIAGSGMWLTGIMQFSGTYPNGAVFQPTSPLVLGAQDWIFCLPGKSRLPLQGLGRSLDCSHPPPISAAVFDSHTQTVSPPATPSMARFRYMASMDAVTNIDPGGTGNLTSYPSYYTGGRIQCPLRVHHNATLATVFFNFKVSQARTALPASQPLFRVIKVDTFGNVTPLLTNSQYGWVSLGAGGPAAYYNAGGIQQFAYNCDANVVIDITQFTYWVQITDESDVAGGNAMAGNQYISVVCSFSNILDLRPA